MSDEIEKKSFFKDHIKTISTSVGAGLAILTGIWQLDNHYASAADISDFKNEVQTQIQEVKVDSQTQLLQIRREGLRDKVEDLNLKEDSQKLTPYEIRQRDRYVKEVNDIDEMLKDITRSKLGLVGKPNTSERKERLMMSPPPQPAPKSQNNGQPYIEPTFKK